MSTVCRDRMLVLVNSQNYFEPCFFKSQAQATSPAEQIYCKRTFQFASILVQLREYAVIRMRLKYRKRAAPIRDCVARHGVNPSRVLQPQSYSYAVERTDGTMVFSGGKSGKRDQAKHNCRRARAENGVRPNQLPRAEFGCFGAFCFPRAARKFVLLNVLCSYP